jgi:hypothetical protein
MLAILTLESLRNVCIIAGEDLGTVPDHVRPTMTKHGMFRLHVAQWSFPSKPGGAPDPSPAEAVASLNTHDTPTFAGWWRGADIEDKLDLDLINDAQANTERRERAQQKTAILAFADASGAPPSAADTLTEVERAMVSMTADLATGPAGVLVGPVELSGLWVLTETWGRHPARRLPAVVVLVEVRQRMRRGAGAAVDRWLAERRERAGVLVDEQAPHQLAPGV